MRSDAARLLELAAQHGITITGLAFASPGRLMGRVDADHDLFDMCASSSGMRLICSGPRSHCSMRVR